MQADITDTRVVKELNRISKRRNRKALDHMRSSVVDYDGRNKRHIKYKGRNWSDAEELGAAR